MADSVAWAEERALPARERADARLTATIARAGILAQALLVALCFLLYLPGLLEIPAVGQDEIRFVQTTRQMLETGGLIDPRLHDEPRYNKPIGIYWLQYAVAEISGLGAEAPVWVYGIVSLLAAIGAVQLTFSAGRRFLSLAGCPAPEVMTSGYCEASVVSAVGTGIKFGDGARAADFLAEGGCRAVIVTEQQMPAFTAELTANGAVAGDTKTLIGLDLGTAVQTTFHVIGAVHG